MNPPKPIPTTFDESLALARRACKLAQHPELAEAELIRPLGVDIGEEAVYATAAEEIRHQLVPNAP